MNLMKSIRILFQTLALLLAVSVPVPLLAADPPGILHHQGLINVDSTPFDGNGFFKFALVDAGGTTTFWSNDGTSTAGGEPTAAVSLTVANGRYSVPLGDTSLANMTSVIQASVFADSADVRLRVWFDDGANGSQLLSPDQRLASVGYALNAAQAETVPDGSITSAMLAAGSVGTDQLGSSAEFNGTFTGDGSGLTGLDSTQLTGPISVSPDALWNIAGIGAGASYSGQSVTLAGSLAYRPGNNCASMTSATRLIPSC